MKTKSAFIIVSLHLCVSVANAQLQTGFKAGANFSWFTKDIDPFAPGSEYYDDYTGFQKYFRTGANIGLFAIYEATNSLSFGSEVLYSSKGAMHRIKNRNVVLINNDGETQNAFDTYTYKIDYAEVPLYLQFNLSSKSNISVDIYAGMSAAYAFNKRRIYRYYEGSGYVSSGDRVKLDKDLAHVRAFNLFPLAGVKVGGGQVFVDLRTNYSFFPVFNKSTNTDGSNLSTRLWTIGVTGGYYF